MNSRSFCKMLQKNGFTLVRRTGHAIFSDGVSRIIVPCHTNRDLDYRLEKQLKIDLRKALEARR